VDIRLNLIRSWLENDLQLTISSIKPASEDASFRRYFRAKTNNGTWIVMDAPPEKESIIEFINIAKALAQAGVHAPAIKAQNIPDGLLLLEDLGSRTYLNELINNADSLYSDAINSLIQIQHGRSKIQVPDYSPNKLLDEMDLFEHWYIEKHLNLSIDEPMKTVWQECKQFLVTACQEQPQVQVHRDFHSRNLMITNENSPGVIDFQDMVIGPIAYDLASIFKDCYIEWPRQQQLHWIEQYRQQANKTLSISNISETQLIRWYDLTGLQRHLKVLGIFCRLYYRDGKNQYLSDLPLVAKYTLETLSLYPELAKFKQLFKPLIKKAL